MYEDTFIADGLLDRLPTPAQIGATRVGGVDLNKPPTCHSGSRLRGPHPGRAVRGPGAVRRVGLLHRRRVHRQVHAITGHTGYTVWQAAYLLRKLRGNELITKPGRTRRYHLQPRTAGSIAALLTLREHVSHRSSSASAAPHETQTATWTSVDHDDEKIRVDMQTRFQELGIRAAV